jgi:hypothetical protein
VDGGGFVVSRQVLSHIKATLASQITAAAKAQGQTLPPWQQFLVQFRATEVKGLRAVEIHGSCQAMPNVDTRKDFVDEQITDGGTCYFLVLYVLDSGRYSNVVFHGYA